MTARPLFEVFMKRAQGVGHILRDRGLWRISGFRSNEPLTVRLVQNNDGSTTLQYHRKSDGDGVVEIRNIKPTGLADVSFGEENILKSEQLGSREEVVDNRNGVEVIDVSFRDLFSQTDSKETGKSSGGSLKVSVESSQSIEGVAEFKESVETEIHEELEETEGSETTKEQEGAESTSVPVGKRVRITQTRARTDGEIEVVAHGQFTHGLTVGKHSGGKFVGGHNGYWDTWPDFSDVVRGEAPDNWDLAPSFKSRPANHADLWALDDLDTEVRYQAKFEGRISVSYRVDQF